MGIPPYAVMPVKVDSDKLSRANGVTPLLESGRLFLPETGPWIETYKTQLTSFPQDAHDDLVDALSQALNYMREQKGDQGIGWLRKIEERSGSPDGSGLPLASKCTRRQNSGWGFGRAYASYVTAPSISVPTSSTAWTMFMSNATGSR